MVKPLNVIAGIKTLAASNQDHSSRQLDMPTGGFSRFLGSRAAISGVRQGNGDCRVLTAFMILTFLAVAKPPFHRALSLSGKNPDLHHLLCADRKKTIIL